MKPDVVVAEWFVRRLADAEDVGKLRGAANELHPKARIIIHSTTPRPATFPEVDRYLSKPTGLYLLYDAINATATKPHEVDHN